MYIYYIYTLYGVLCTLYIMQLCTVQCKLCCCVPGASVACVIHWHYIMHRYYVWLSYWDFSFKLLQTNKTRDFVYKEANVSMKREISVSKWNWYLNYRYYVYYKICILVCAIICIQYGNISMFDSRGVYCVI